MEKKPRKPAISLLAALAGSLALLAGATASVARAGQQAAPLVNQQCRAVRIKKRVRSWAWLPERRKIHGHRVVVRRHRRVVHVHVRVWRVEAVVRVLCSPVLPAGLPPQSLTSPAPTPLMPAQPVSPPLPPPVGGSPQPPVNTAPPVTSGVDQQGRMLTASPGSWTGSPIGFGYEWLRCDSTGANCSPIVQATDPSYSVTGSDVGSTLRVAVVASNAIGASGPAISTQTEVVTAAAQPPANTGLPTISGDAQQGKILAASSGNWTNGPTSYAYRWRRCNTQGSECVTIAGASGSTYVAGPTDVGFTVLVKVIAYNAAGHSSAISAPTDVISGPTGAPAHVMVIVEENRSRSEVIDASDMPYLNSLATKYGDTTNWSGVAHPSLPNYLALISGSTEGVTDDGCEYSFVGAQTIGSELSLAGISWKAYLEELPEAGSELCTFGDYAKKHNPFAYFPETNGPNVVPASQFQTDESSGQLPDFIFYVPNLTNDGHDGANEQVDNYLKALIPPVLASSWYAQNGTIIITWDEGTGEEEIPTVVIHGAGSGQVLTATGNHFGTLATIEDLFAVPRLGGAAGATTLAPLLK